MQTKSLSAVETLRAARKLIEKPESWTQMVYGRDDAGVSTEAWNSDAVCRCSAGAIFGVVGGFSGGYLAIDALRAAIGGNPNAPEASVTIWNDERGRTHAEVMVAFDHAISLAEANS